MGRALRRPGGRRRAPTWPARAGGCSSAGERLALAGTTIGVVATPGHTADHLAFRLESGAVLVGDHVLGRGTSVVTHPEGDVVAYLESLRRVHDLGPSALYCGHGPELTEDPGAVLDFYLAHRAYREHQLLAALAAGAGDGRRAGRRRLRRGAAAAVAGRRAVDPRHAGQAARRGPGRGRPSRRRCAWHDRRPGRRRPRTASATSGGRPPRSPPRGCAPGTGCSSPPRPRRRCWPSCSARCAPASSPSSSTRGCRRPSGPRWPRTPTRRSTSADDPAAAAAATTRPTSPTCRWPGRCTTRPGRRAGARACGPGSSPRTTPGRWPPRRSTSGASGRATGTSCSRRCTTAPRCASRSTRCSPAARCCCPGPFDAARAAAAISTLRPDDDVLRADPPAAAARPRRRRLVVVPPAGARRRPVPRTAQARGPRGAPRRQRLGVLRLDRGAVHRLLAGGLAGAPGQRRAGPARTAAGDRRARPAVVRRPAVGAVRVLAGAGEDRGRLARRPGHRRRPRPGGRRRHGLARRPPRGPGHLRRRERLPGRGGGGPRRPSRTSWRARCSAFPTRSGGSGWSPPTSGAADPAELAAWARERLAAAKRPKGLHRLDELPRTSTGKVRRLDLPEVLGLA